MPLRSLIEAKIDAMPQERDAPLDVNQYKSDYDLLVIVNQKDVTDCAAYWDETAQRIATAYNFKKILRTPANFVVNSLQTRTVFLLHRIDDLTYREIGERLDVSSPTVQYHVGRALARISTALESE